MILHWIWRGELVFSSLEMMDCKNKAHRAKYMDRPAMLSNHNLWEVTAHWVFFHESLTKSYHHKITTYRNEKNHRSVILAASVIWRALIGQRLHGHSSSGNITVVHSLFGATKQWLWKILFIQLLETITHYARVLQAGWAFDFEPLHIYLSLLLTQQTIHFYHYPLRIRLSSENSTPSLKVTLTLVSSKRKKGRYCVRLN